MIQVDDELNLITRTNHTQTLAWRSWRNGLPDISPGNLGSDMFMTIRDATEATAMEILAPKMEKSELGGERYRGPTCLLDLYEAAFYRLDADAFKLLKKIFDTVVKTYITVTFSDSAGVAKPFTAYATPGVARSLHERSTTTAALNTTEVVNEFQARLALAKGNMCVAKDDIYLCGQPVSGKVLCTHWVEPEEGNRYQCYYQERNPSQKDFNDGLLCACGSAQDTVMSK